MRFLAFFLTISVFVLKSAVANSAPHDSDITIGYAALRISLPIFVADDRGLFRQHGLNVTLQKYDTAQPMIDALISGKINVGGYSALPITFSAMARSKVNLLFLTALMEDQSHPVSQLIVTADSGIHAIADLTHKRIGILPTRAYEVWLRMILDKNGVDPNTVIIQQVPPYLEADALISGSIQALFTNDPGATSALSRPNTKRLVDGALVPKYIYEPFYFGSFNVREDYAKAHPDVVFRLSQALDEAIKIIDSDQNYAKSLMEKYIDPNLTNITPHFPDSLYRKTSEINQDDLEKIYEYYRSSDVVASDLDLKGDQYHQ